MRSEVKVVKSARIFIIVCCILKNVLADVIPILTIQYRKKNR